MHTHHRLQSALSILVIVLLAASLSGCGQTSITLTLQLVVAAAESAVSVLSSTGQIDPATGAKITTYLSQVSDAVVFATDELRSGDSAIIKAERIVTRFSAIAKPDLPSGLPQAIVSVIQAVALSVANFLNTVNTTAALKSTASASAAASSLSKADLNALPKIRARAVAVKARLGT